ncbi:unnamed protein product [Camellia sinensis]
MLIHFHRLFFLVRLFPTSTPHTKTPNEKAYSFLSLCPRGRGSSSAIPMAAMNRLLKPSQFSSSSAIASLRRCLSSAAASETESRLKSRSCLPPSADPKGRNVQWVFLGCPGVGKGTYASRLSSLLSVPHIATGDLVRQELSSHGPLSHQNEEDKSPATHPTAKPRRSSHYVSSAMLGLVGQIPANTIGNLTQLRILSLRANRLSGSIPSDFSNLKLLRSLYLQNNLFSGKYDSNNGFSGSKLLRSVVKLRWRRQQPGLAHCRNLRRRHRRRHRRPMPRCSPSAATASANVGVATASAITGCTRYVIYVKKGTYKENVVIGSSKKLIIMVACTLLCFFYDNAWLAEIVNQGKLVSDEIIIRLLSKRLEAGEAKGESGFILDGFPRTIRQAEILDEVTYIDLVVNLKLPENVLLEKCLGRRICSECGKNFNVASINVKGENGNPDISMAPLLSPPQCASKLITRSDDTEIVVKERLRIYNEKSKPLEEFYRNQGKLLEFDLPGGIPESWPKLLEALNLDDCEEKQSAAA